MEKVTEKLKKEKYSNYTTKTRNDFDSEGYKTTLYS